MRCADELIEPERAVALSGMSRAFFQSVMKTSCSGSMTSTVLRSSVAKWPDIGATSSTRGCTTAASLRKCSSVPNGVSSAASSVTPTSWLPTSHEVDAEGRAAVRQPGLGEQAPTRAQVTQRRGRGAAAGFHKLRQAGAKPRDLAERHQEIGLGLVELVDHRRSVVLVPGGGSRV